MNSQEIKFMYKSNAMHDWEEQLVLTSDPSIIDLNENPNGYKSHPRRVICKLTTEYQFSVAPENCFDRDKMAFLTYMLGDNKTIDFTSIKNWDSEDRIRKFMSEGKHICTAWIEIYPDYFTKILAMAELS